LEANGRPMAGNGRPDGVKKEAELAYV